MDKKRCEELIIAYGELLEGNAFDEERVAAIFAENAHAVLPHAGEATGIAELTVKHCEMMGPFTGAHHNITNIVIRPESETAAQVGWHMEVIHQFRPEIATNLPGDLFIVNDRVKAGIVEENGQYKIGELAMETVFKRFAVSAPE